MKLYLAYNTIDAPYGGANQFFGSLKKELEKTDSLASTPQAADAIVFNSHTLGGKKGNGAAAITRLKYQFPEKIFIHRVDGPVSIYRADATYQFVDRLIYRLNEEIADGTVYQSAWSREANLAIGKKPTPFQATILNAPDPTIFYPAAGTTDFSDRKIKIIASSFSNHPNKGFSVYQWLDQNLDWSRYEMTFVGNSPIAFANITHLPAVPPTELADLLRAHDIYLTASQKDPCSNALIEALHCGLPAIALRDGGHPEIVGTGGELFESEEEIPMLLERIGKKYEQYLYHSHLPDISSVAQEYLSLVEPIVRQIQNGKYQPKKLSLLGFVYRYSYYRLRRTLRIIMNKLLAH
jgi:glycosyltransferase involved in cell wall biosynthesis